MHTHPKSYRAATLRFAPAIILSLAGCGPTRLLPPPPDLPTVIQGRILWNTPAAAIYARDKAVAGEAESLVTALSADLKSCADRPLTRGILIIVDTADPQPLVATLEQAETLGKNTGGRPQRRRTRINFGNSAVKRHTDKPPSRSNETTSSSNNEPTAHSGDAPKPPTTGRPTSEPATQSSLVPTSQPTTQPTKRSAAETKADLEEIGISEDMICRMVVAPLDEPTRTRLGLTPANCTGFDWIICCPSKRQTRDSVSKMTDAALTKEGGFGAKLLVAPWMPLILSETAKKLEAGAKLVIAQEWSRTQTDWTDEQRQDLIEALAKRLGIDEPMDLPGATSRPADADTTAGNSAPAAP